MNSARFSRGIVVLAGFAALGGCKKEQGSESTAAQSVTQSSTDLKDVESVFFAYEKIRLKLAADDTTVQADAKALGDAATVASETSPASLKSHLQSVAKAGAALAEAQGGADVVRKAFGEVSRPVVAILAAEPRLAEGRHVFECPMAQGYKKWVQTSEEISNPYMGSRMLACGSKSKP